MKKSKFPISNFQFLISNSGFSIIELVVSVAIIGMMAGLFFTNYRGGGIKTDLIGTVQKLASDIRLAQNFSLGTKEFNGITPRGGWGVHIDNNSNNYFIFADDNGNYEYDEDNDEKYSTIQLPANLIINDINVDSVVTYVDIVFLPPDPQVYINTEVNKNVEITVQENINQNTKRVVVNFLGLIDVVN